MLDVLPAFGSSWVVKAGHSDGQEKTSSLLSERIGVPG